MSSDQNYMLETALLEYRARLAVPVSLQETQTFINITFPLESEYNDPTSTKLICLSCVPYFL